MGWKTFDRIFFFLSRHHVCKSVGKSESTSCNAAMLFWNYSLKRFLWCFKKFSQTFGVLYAHNIWLNFSKQSLIIRKSAWKCLMQPQQVLCDAWWIVLGVAWKSSVKCLEFCIERSYLTELFKTSFFSFFYVTKSVWKYVLQRSQFTSSSTEAFLCAFQKVQSNIWSST